MHPRILLLGAVLVVGISFIQYSRMSLATDYRHWVLTRSLQGVGYAFFFVPLSVLAYSQLNPAQNNKASSITNFFRNWGGSVGISLVTTLSERRSAFHQSILGANQTATTGLLRDSITSTRVYLESHGFSQTGALKAAYLRVYQSLGAQANFLAYMDCFYILGVITLLAAPLVILTRGFKIGKGSSASH